MNADLRKCLLNTGPLIMHLEKFSTANISLNLETQFYGRAQHNGSAILGLSDGDCVLLREVFLLCNNHPWVYARTTIPTTTLQSAPKLAHWGDKPLGNYLFSDKFIYRGKIEIAKIKMISIPYRPIKKLALKQDDFLWGRRSIFYIKNKPLLVTEIFLPEAVKYISLKRE